MNFEDLFKDAKTPHLRGKMDVDDERNS